MKNNILLIALCLFAGLIGGFISNQVFNENKAFAEGEQGYGTLVQAQELRLVDKNGKPVAALAISADSGDPFLAIYDKKDGNYRVMIDIVEGNPRLTLRDSSAQTRLVLGSAEVINKTKETMERRAASSIVLFDREGKLIWSAP